VWIGFDWLRTGTGGGCCECGDEPSGYCATELVFTSIIYLVPRNELFEPINGAENMKSKTSHLEI
jgi:hypothetical protein